LRVSVKSVIVMRVNVTRIDEINRSKETTGVKKLLEKIVLSLVYGNCITVYISSPKC